MKNVILVRLKNGSTVLINENQVCSVEQGELIENDKKIAVVTMSNGSIFLVEHPDFDQWENDIYA